MLTYRMYLDIECVKVNYFRIVISSDVYTLTPLIVSTIQCNEYSDYFLVLTT